MIKTFKHREQRGFSLVELMIVVAIIAILAAIAIPAFMRFALKSKTSEATGNLSAIRTCEEAFRAENDVFLVCPQSPVALNTPPSKPQIWVEVVTAGMGTDPDEAFSTIGFEPDGDVRYQYEVTVGTIGTPATPNFVAIATGDLDDDTALATFTVTKGAPGYPKPERNIESGATGDF